MTRLQVCVAAVAVLLLRGALAQRETVQDESFRGDVEDMGGSGGLTVQEPPAGWPLSELRAYEHHGQHHGEQHGDLQHERTGRWEASADTSPWTAVEETEPEAAASESRGSVRWFSATPAPLAAVPVEDQQSMPAEPGQWYAEVPFQQGLPPRQGRVLAANPETNLNMPPPQSAPLAPEHAVAFFATPQDAEAAAGSDAPAGQPWQPSNSRYKRKRKQNKQIQQQVEQEQMMHHQQQEQQQQQQRQYLPQQQQPQLQQDDPQLQHEAPPVEVKKTKKTVKRVNKRRPPPTYAPQPQPIIISNGAPGPQGPQGPDPTVSVGYSIGFAAPDGGAVVGGGVAAPPQLQAPGGQDYQKHRGTVQNDVVQGEVVHGEGAVSYSNTLLGNKAVTHQPTQGVNVVNVVSSSAINGRPIYVPPLQQSSAPSGPSGPPAGYQPLPTPQALVGSPSPSYTLSVVTAAPSTGPVVVSTTPSYVVRTPHTIFGSGSTTKNELALGTPSRKRKPPKAASAVLHINDGTDFAWQDVGNGVEVSAPITPNGLRGGYRDSIPIMEDTDDDAEQPGVPFEASTAAGLHAAAPTGSSPFNHDYVLSHSTQFGQTNALYGGAESGRVEVPSNHLPDDPPGLSARPSSKPDPFRGFTSSSFADFMRAYSSTGRQPHSTGGSPFASPSFDGPPEAVVGSKLVQGQVYYLPSDTPGGHPIPAVIMPLSRLRELHAALPSGKKPVYNLPPDTNPAPDTPFKSPSFAEFPFKSFQDAPFKSSVFSESPFKSEAPFKTSSSLSQTPFPSLPDSPFKGPPSTFAGDHRGPPPSKYRPSSPFKGKDPFHKPSGGFPRPHHLSGFSSKPHGLRFGPSPSGPSPTGSSVKITKSVPVFEEHKTVSKQPHKLQHQGSSHVVATAEDANPTLQWPPKESVNVQTHYLPIEQYDSLKGNALVPSGHRPSFHHGHPRGPPTLHREVRRPPPHRPVRAPLPSAQPSAAPSHHHHSHGQLEPGAFAVSSSYRVRPSG